MTNPLDGRQDDHTTRELERMARERIEAEQAEIDGSDYDGDTPFTAEAERLRLGDSEERLPWLESDDDYADDTVDTARIATVAVVGLLVVVALVGAIWWFSTARPDTELLAEGSTIEAPAEPFRARPENPGGRDAEGTGDVSYEVGEGQDRATQMGEAPAAPTPTATPTAAASPAASAAARPSIDRAQAAAPASTGGVGVQVGAYSSRATADTGWAQLTRDHPALAGVSHRIVQAQVDGNTVFRLQAVSGNVSSAEALCRAIKSGGGDCRVAN